MEVSEEQVVNAIHGYVLQNGLESRNGFEPLKFLRANTIFAPSKFPGYVEAFEEQEVPEFDEPDPEPVSPEERAKWSRAAAGGFQSLTEEDPGE